MGFLRKINPFDNDDKEKKERKAREEREAREREERGAREREEARMREEERARAEAQASVAVEAPVAPTSGSTSAGSSVQDIVAEAEAARAGGDGVATPSSATASTSSPAATAEPMSASVPVSNEGAVAGSGPERSYTSRAGDTLEAIAAYFYGDPVHRQRLIDDNPALQSYADKPLPAGVQMKVGEDAARGDTVAG